MAISSTTLNNSGSSLWSMGRGRLTDVQLEELRLLEAKHAGKDTRGKALRGAVVLADHVVVMLPGEPDAVFGRLELLLKSQEILVGLQVGVGLGYSKKAFQGAA